MLLTGLLVLVSSGTGLTTTNEIRLEQQSLDGRGNNQARPEFGQAGRNYRRVAQANYADGRNTPVGGSNSRFISNRVFNDINQNVFSERKLSQWGAAWGQFIDSDIALRDDAGAKQDIAFRNTDPLESFRNDSRKIPFRRSRTAPGTGVTNAAQQINKVSSFIDASALYGVTEDRLEWLRAGPVDGKVGNNEPFLLLPGGQLPRRNARGDVGKAPEMKIDGRLRERPDKAAVAGDVRANQNLALLAVHTLFAREHNRIASRLPRSLTEEQRFQVARRVVIAEQQFITYNEFLPAMGVRLAPYRGYDPHLDPTVGNEFATVGFRAHSMVHGELEIEADAARYSASGLKAIKSKGIEVDRSADGREVALTVPLNVGFFNPDLLPLLQLGPVLQGLGLEAQYQNDEQIDNQLRSVLFQIPSRRNPKCLDGPDLPKCFKGVVDLGAIDIERGRDHGMPTYNDMRRAFGLAPLDTFEAITGDASDAFLPDAALTRGQEINDPDSLDFVRLFDADGRPIRAGGEAAEADVVTAIRRTTLAARLKAMYGSVDKVDAFVGMVSEPRVAGAELGELQLAMWKKQFEALRDGDRFFFLNDPGLNAIRKEFGIDFRLSLADVIAANTDIRRAELRDNVFFAEGDEEEGADARKPTGSDPRPTAPRPGRTPGRDAAPGHRNDEPGAAGDRNGSLAVHARGPRGMA